MQSEVLHRDARLAKRFGPMGLVIDGKLTATRDLWLGVMATATERFNEWGRAEDGDAFHYASERVREIDDLIRDLGPDAPATDDDFASLAAIRAITEGDVQADWKAFCNDQFDGPGLTRSRKTFGLDQPAHYADLHTGAMAEPTYDPRNMAKIDRALMRVVGWCSAAGALALLFFA